MRVITILAALIAITCLPPVAAELKCSTYPTPGASNAALQAMAKVTSSDARKAALTPYGKAKAEVSEGGLEAENGCLVYSFDIRVSGKQGVDEVLVDAGTGSVLKRTDGTPKQEVEEGAADRAQAGKHGSGPAIGPGEPLASSCRSHKINGRLSFTLGKHNADLAKLDPDVVAVVIHARLHGTNYFACTIQRACRRAVGDRSQRDLRQLRVMETQLPE